MILRVLIAMVAGWLKRYQQQVISYLLEENRVLKAYLGGRRLRLTDTERRRLAALAHPLGRKRLTAVASLATPDTLLRWYKRLIAAQFDGSTQRRLCGRPRVAEEVEQLVVQSAGERSRLSNGSRGTARTPWWTAQLLSSRGSLTRCSLSTIRQRACDAISFSRHGSLFGGAGHLA